MPFDNGRCTNTDEKRFDLRRRALSKRLAEQRKECHVPEVALRNAEQRLMCIVSSPYVYCVLVPVLSPLQGFEQRSPDQPNIDGFKSLPSPLEATHTDLCNNVDSANIVSSGLSSETFNLDQNESRNSLALHQNSSNNVLPTSLSSVNTYNMVSGNMSADCSEFLVKDTLKAEKRVKRSSRKKGKKKGKQRKRTRSRKIPNESDVQCDNPVASVSESSTKKIFSSYTDKAISEENLARKRMPTMFLDRDSAKKKDCTENSSEYVDCLVASRSCTSYSEEMDDSELSGSNGRFVGEEFKHTTIALQDESSLGDSPKALLSTFPDGIGDFSFEENNKFDDASFSPVENSGASSLADSFHDEWNTDISSANGSEDMDILSTIKKESNSLDGEAITCTKKIGASSRTSSTDSCHVITEISEENCVANPYWSNDVLDACSILERAECSSQASSSDDFRPVVYGKRDRRTKKITDNESFRRANGSFVQAMDSRVRKDDKTSIFGSNNSASKFDDKPLNASKIILKQEKGFNLQEKGRRTWQYLYSDEAQRHHKESWQMADIIKSHQPRAKQTFGSFLLNIKYKSSSVGKVTKQSSGSKSYGGKCIKNNTLENDFIHCEASKTSPPNHIDETDSCLEIQFSSDSTQLSAGAGDCCKSEQEQELLIPVSLDSKCTLAGNNTPPSSCSDLDQLLTGFGSSSEMLDSDSSVFSGDMCEDTLVQASEKKPSLKFETAAALPGDNLQDSMSPVPNSTHVERTLVVQDDKSVDSLRPADVDELFSCALVSNNAALPLQHSDESSNFPALDDGFLCSRPTSEEAEDSSVESVHLSNKLRSSLDSTDVTKCQQPLEFETDLGKITRAVVDAYKVQVVAEGAQKIAGSPIADFEKFLNSASPVIGQMHSSMKGSAVSCQEQAIGPSLCSDWVPGFTLKNLWQWYEEPGCFGLEVKALKSHKSKRSSTQVTEFNAYFVPYLSAVQIFGNSRNARCHKHFEEAFKTSEAYRTPDYMTSLPFLSLLLPESHKEFGNFLSELPASDEDELTDQPVMSNADARELLFEYFETDQPPWRRPLFEKIQDLVSGDTLSKSRLFGNPEMLESLDLQDIHPASWYSVAWYPICRIPEGNIRAAFLTYHSLGHIVQKSVSCNAGYFKNVVCPVVGLQTYNDKGESWFQQRVPDSVAFDLEDTPYTKPSELIRERLRTLKETAAVMATAVISKSNMRSVNRHPDYDFFLSRS